MNNDTSAFVKQAAEAEVARVKQQLTDNAPEHLASTGTETVIKLIGPFGCYIDQPGKYVLEKDIHWASTSGAIAAITIQCSNVELDFNGFGISTVMGDDPSHRVYGVAVSNLDQTCSNVTIKNGSISNMGLAGIWAADTKGLSISQMTIEGLTYSGYEEIPAAVSLFLCNSFTIELCVAKNLAVTAKIAGGFMVIASSEGTLSECAVDEFTNNDGVACGFPYVESNKIKTETCTATSLTTYSLNNPASDFGHTCIGYMVTDCTNLTYTDCSSHHLHGCCDDCHGMSMWPANDVLISNFTASHVHDGLGPQKTGAKATGVEVHGNNVRVVNCQVNDITAIVPQFMQAAGFSACGTGIIFENCTATGVAVLGPNGNADPAHRHGYGTGFGWAPDPRVKKPAAMEVAYLNCTANDCQLGFDTWNHQHSSWDNPTTNETAQEYLIQVPGTERILSQNFCSELANSTPKSAPVPMPVRNVIENNNHYPRGWGISQGE